MNLFFIHVDNDKAWLDGEEARHCVKVLRLGRGDAIAGTDGCGNFIEGMIRDLKKDYVEIEITSKKPNYGEKPQNIHLAVSLLHKPDRLEWLFEKSVELGVTSIHPFISKNTVKTGFRKDRMEKILVSALKQSFRSKMPTLDEPESFEDLLDSADSELKIICKMDAEIPISGLSEKIKNAASVFLLIGPEGDFTPEEIERAISKGFIPVHLGANRLRTETAAIHCLSSVKFLMGY